jgi:hypothetical protein
MTDDDYVDAILAWDTKAAGGPVVHELVREQREGYLLADYTFRDGAVVRRESAAEGAQPTAGRPLTHTFTLLILPIRNAHGLRPGPLKEVESPRRQRAVRRH